MTRDRERFSRRDCPARSILAERAQDRRRGHEEATCGIRGRSPIESVRCHRGCRSAQSRAPLREGRSGSDREHTGTCRRPAQRRDSRPDGDPSASGRAPGEEAASRLANNAKVAKLFSSLLIRRRGHIEPSRSKAHRPMIPRSKGFWRTTLSDYGPRREPGTCGDGLDLPSTSPYRPVVPLRPCHSPSYLSRPLVTATFVAVPEPSWCARTILSLWHSQPQQLMPIGGGE